MKQAMRRAVAALLFYSGLNALYRRATRRKSAAILAYHRVLPAADARRGCVQPGMYVTDKSFEMQMQYLSRHYRVVAATDLIATLRSGALFEESTCGITFDDGWRDTYDHAFPILRRYGLPATVFLVTDHVGRFRMFWPDRMARLAGQYWTTRGRRRGDGVLSPALARLGIIDLAADHGRLAADKVDELIEQMKDLEAEEIEQIVGELETLVGEQSSGERSVVNWAEVEVMRQAGVSIGSHTRTHLLLTRASKERAREELVVSRAEIERRLAEPCRGFAYPNGDCDADVKNVVAESYEWAVTTQRGLVRPGDDPFGLKRLMIHEDGTCTKALFACRISGILGRLGL